MAVISIGPVLEGPLWLSYIEASAPAGFPSPADDYLETPLDLNDFLIGKNKAATFLMRVTGESMKEDGILDGDLLVVDRAAQPTTGSVVVVALNGEFTVKRMRRVVDGVWLEPANPRFQSIHVTTGDELHIFGVVRHSIHSLR